MNRSYVCNTCSKEFITQKGYEKHVQMHSMKRHYKCDRCSNIFATIDDLGLHLSQHAVYTVVNEDEVGK